MDGELSEEQRAALEERRQRSDKISRLMGPYLLKRYRMLSEACNVCKNILLQSPQGVKYCVNCEEIEKDQTRPSEPITQPPEHTEHFNVTADINHPTACRVNVDYKSIENVLLAKLQAAVMALQETNSTEVIIQQCQVIKACSEAVMAVRRLTIAPAGE